MDIDQYNAIQDQMFEFREQMTYSRDQKNLNSDIDQAGAIAKLKQAGDFKELLEICKRQGVEPHCYVHLLPSLDTRSEQNDALSIEQERIIATGLATLLFRELFLPPANHSPHAEMLAAFLTSVYPDLAPEVFNATDISDEPANDTEQDDLFFAPRNLEFRSKGYYKPLNRRKKEIRLISLRAGKQDQDVRCTLMDPISLLDIQCELLDPFFPKHKRRPPYTALSYSAGDLKKTTKIYVNDIEFEVFESLERALRRIRHRQYAVHVWIDQISIDQHNNPERAWQVGIMRDIYSTARRTLVFLDIRGHDDLSARFKKFFLMVYNRASGNVITKPELQPQNTSIEDLLNQQLNLGSAKFMENLRPVLSQERETSQWLASILLQTEYMPCLTFLIAMYNVPWWHRSWVYQELIVSRDVILLCGNEEINWSAFQVFNKHIIRAASLLEQSPLPTFNLPGPQTYYGFTGLFLQRLKANQPAIAQLGRIRENFLTFGECDLRWLLSIWRDLKSTDDRDKVYAVTGIAKSRYRIVPEYTPHSTINKLLVEVVRRSVFVDGKLDIILDGGEPKRHTDWNLPSWVPDFTVPTSRKFPVFAAQSRHPEFDNSTSQAGPGPNAEYVFRAMDDLTPEFEFLSKPVTSPNDSSSSSASGIPPVLRIKLVRRWSLQYHELGLVGKPPMLQSMHKSWFSLACERPKAYATAVDNDPESAPYPYTDNEDLTSAYLQTVHFYPDIEAVTSAMNYEKKPPRSISMTQHQLAVREDAERVLMKGREAQKSGNWRFFCTDDLVMGMVPASTQAGDWICFAGGTSVPFVTRPNHGSGVDGIEDDKSRMKGDTSPGRATVVGAAYVHGYMFGRAAEELAGGVTKMEWVDLY